MERGEGDCKGAHGNFWQVIFTSSSNDGSNDFKGLELLNFINLYILNICLLWISYTSINTNFDHKEG